MTTETKISQDDDRFFLTCQGAVTVEFIARAKEVGMRAGDFMTKAQEIADLGGISLKRLLEITA